MLNVGLTGNIAAGKSTVVELFKKWGATVIDADALAREAQAPGSAVLAPSRNGSDQRLGLRRHPGPRRAAAPKSWATTRPSPR